MGTNWGYAVPEAQREFAHRLIDTAGVDVVHGHSSHHPKGIEVHRDRLVLYGCGDFLNDYEGIAGHVAFRSDLALMYFPTVDAGTGELTRLLLTPTRIRHFRVNRARGDEVGWLERMLNREGRGLGTSVERLPDETLALKWRRLMFQTPACGSASKSRCIDLRGGSDATRTLVPRGAVASIAVRVARPLVARPALTPLRTAGPSTWSAVR